MSVRPSYLKHHKLSAYDRESLALAALAAASLAGIALCWWLG
jgi:hypothetical protein